MEKVPVEQLLYPVILVDLENLILKEKPMPEVPVTVKDMLRKSIKTFKGIKYPLIISKDFEIFDGRTRYEIAKELGMKSVPCIISDNEENPKEHVLMYDLELARRSLSNKERSKLEIERDKRLAGIEGDLLGKYLKNIIPVLRSSVERVFKATGDLSLIIKVARLDKDDQQELVAVASAGDDTPDEIRQKYNKLIEEKKNLSVELKSSRKDLKDLQSKFDVLNEEYVFLKNEAYEKIARQKAEIEKRIREQLVSGAPEEIKKLLEDHTATLTQKYESELEETHQMLKEVSVTLNKKKEELVQKEDALKKKEMDATAFEEDYKEANDEIIKLKAALQGLVQPLKFINSLDTVFNDLNNIHSGILSAGNDKFSDDHREKIKINLTKIESVLRDLKELYGVPPCDCQMINKG